MMMEYMLLALSVGAASARSLVSKNLSEATRSIGSFGFVNLLISLSAFFCVLIYTLITGDHVISAQAIFLGILYALFTVSAQLFYMRAMLSGRIADVTFIYSCGFLIPTAAGLLFWHERLSPVGIAGILLLIPALRLCGAGSEGAGKRGGGFWAILAMLSSGALGIIQKQYSSSEDGSHTGGFILLAMGVSVLLSAGLMPFGSKKSAIKPLFNRSVICISLLCGIFVAAANVINLTLTGVIPAVILFPVFNGGVVILSAVFALVFCGEKITRRSAIGLLLGLAGTVLAAFK